jgi:hypothetical protein
MSVAGRVKDKAKFEDDIEMTTGINSIRLPRDAAVRSSVKANVDSHKENIQDTVVNKRKRNVTSRSSDGMVSKPVVSKQNCENAGPTVNNCQTNTDIADSRTDDDCAESSRYSDAESASDGCSSNSSIQKSTSATLQTPISSCTPALSDLNIENSGLALDSCQGNGGSTEIADSKTGDSCNELNKNAGPNSEAFGCSLTSSIAELTSVAVQAAESSCVPATSCQVQDLAVDVSPVAIEANGITSSAQLLTFPSTVDPHAVYNVSGTQLALLIQLLSSSSIVQVAPLPVNSAVSGLPESNMVTVSDNQNAGIIQDPDYISDCDESTSKGTLPDRCTTQRKTHRKRKMTSTKQLLPAASVRSQPRHSNGCADKRHNPAGRPLSSRDFVTVDKSKQKDKLQNKRKKQQPMLMLGATNTPTQPSACDDHGTQFRVAVQDGGSTQTSKKKASVASDSITGKKVTVMATANNGNERVYDKRYYCLFCDRPWSKIKSHLINIHHNELQVAKMMACQDRKAANLQLIKLRNLGNHKHNSDVLREGRGELVVVYRPSTAVMTPDNYAPCPNCYGYYEVKQIWKHMKRKCPLGVKEGEERIVIARARNLLPVPDSIRASTRTILSAMRRDEVYRAAVNDRLAMEYANKLTLKHFSDTDKHELVRAKVREMGRLLVCLKREKMIESLSDAFQPSKFKDLVSCVRKVSGFDEVTGTYDIPSLALKLGHCLRKCAMLLKSQALQETSCELESRADAFDRLYAIDWESEVSSVALRCLNDRKLNRITVMPLARDISKMSDFLSQLVQNSIDTLSSEDIDGLKHIAFVSLTEATLAQIVLFNRRRAGEVSKMKLIAYNDGVKVSESTVTDVHQHLSPVEKQLCKVLTRVEIPGKRGRPVPVLLTAKFKEAVDHIIANRKTCGVLDNNEFVFARPSSARHFRCCDVLRRFSVLCGAQFPETLRSTKLRKHIATVSQVVNLKDNELDLLAQFLGHNIQVHRDFYRLPSDVLQTAKVAKLLIALETGQQLNLTGKTLDEIDLNMDEGMRIRSDKWIINSFKEDDNTILCVTNACYCKV